ncbi:hypothetical protein OIU76_022260 [Salix suchowensis]|nr:hypothetical protein OIU76_022260 [Salix suchowensis]
MKSTEHGDDGYQRELEILKAVAQAWHGHSGSPRSTSEHDAYRQNFQSKPSRFKLEAMNKSSAAKMVENVSWDFRQSLWDSHEIVTVSRRLERELVLDHDPFSRVDARRRRYLLKPQHKQPKTCHQMRNTVIEFRILSNRAPDIGKVYSFGKQNLEKIVRICAVYSNLSYEKAANLWTRICIL